MPRRTKSKKKKKTKQKINSGLGRAIFNKYGGKPDITNNASGKIKRDNKINKPFKSNNNNNISNNKNIISITEVSTLQEFIDTIETNKKLKQLDDNDDIKLIENDNSEMSNHAKLNKLELYNYKNLPIPRKPKWNKNITKNELIEMENKIFLNWRRNLSRIASKSNLKMTPFEKNILIWKQLWNVIEKSNLLILIVDARNPLAFISRDLFEYVKEVDSNKSCLLLINKADYLTPLQRQMWRNYFNSQNIRIIYFSAQRENIRLNLLSKSNKDKLTNIQHNLIIANIDNINCDRDVLNIDELIKLFFSYKRNDQDKMTVGFIGYPNVGKSSIINVLMGIKKVSVSSRPGRTKILQTLYLPTHNDIVLCDCPGLVFPTLMSSKSDMILNGIIPIDNLNDFISPTRLILHRIKINNMNDYYKLKLPINKNPKYIKFINIFDILDAYCHQKKMYNKLKVPNRNEAARIMLKDYVNGKLVYNHYPPNLSLDNKYLFYNGNILINNDNVGDNDNNVLDQAKLHSNNNDNVDMDMDMDMDVDIDVDIMDDNVGNVDDNNVSNMDNNADNTNNNNNNTQNYDITDEEFLELWKHPMNDYSGGAVGSKKKKEKKARVMRRIQKKTSKQNRQYRRDNDNFQTGSNAVTISSVPHIKTKHQPVKL